MNLVREFSITEKVLAFAERLEDDNHNFMAGAVMGLVDYCELFGAALIAISAIIMITRVFGKLLKKKADA